jgi:hypothetical protein
LRGIESSSIQPIIKEHEDLKIKITPLEVSPCRKYYDNIFNMSHQSRLNESNGVGIHGSEDKGENSKIASS